MEGLGSTCGGFVLAVFRGLERIHWGQLARRNSLTCSFRGPSGQSGGVFDFVSVFEGTTPVLWFQRDIKRNTNIFFFFWGGVVQKRLFYLFLLFCMFPEGFGELFWPGFYFYFFLVAVCLQKGK